MVKAIIAVSAIVFTLAAPASAQKKGENGPSPRADVKFLDDIEISLDGKNNVTTIAPKNFKTATTESPLTNSLAIDYTASANLESASNLQLKYGILLNTEIESVKNFSLYQAIDEWYGTPYQYGGSTKNGIDCSAFTKSIYSTLYSINLPRTAKEQSDALRPVDRNELREGDLVFFNTTGGVSHVGMYLQNNKFVHAAVSEGVMISDLDDSYWAKRFISAGRYDTAIAAPSVITFSEPQP